ncbi:hypothetical protein ABXZ88_003251 [Vibrio fluvialis]
MTAAKQCIKPLVVGGIPVALLLSASAGISAPLTPAQFKDVLALKQQYLMTQPHVSTAITLSEQVFMLECNYALTKTDLSDIMSGTGLSLIANKVAQTANFWTFPRQLVSRKSRL